MTLYLYTATLLPTGAVERTETTFAARPDAEAALAAFRLANYADRGALAYLYTITEAGECQYFDECNFYGATVQTVEGPHPLERLFSRALASGQRVAISTGA